MDSDEITLEEKCENLMNVVVESRKRFGKIIKPKNQIPNIDVDLMRKEVDDFMADILERKKRVENLKKNLKDAQHIVLQLNKDKIGKKLRQPLSAETMLAVAKNNQLT
ncbi:unnamed protein product [Parnassius apollo]|uniref:(apollo) hypothetical protein n=1 Tax=Parnassius apollo TaxID=110799 RepID=A0A8S3XX28_PARAO|nr:unnamed protein product [Parnassius apollo]